MKDILALIIESKKEEIAQFKPLSSVERFEKEGFFWELSRRSLKQSLLAENSTGIIAEFKRKSPSKGWFLTKGEEIEKVAIAYNDHGAAAISVLTDEPFFGGTLDDLIQARVLCNIPILRKEFIIDPWQIAEARAFGADVVLLIAACLSVQQVQDLAAYAKSLGMETILELHGEDELGHICDDTEIIGINNRNLKTFEVDIDRSLRMAAQISADKIKIAESGINSIENILLFKENGFKGFLIGELFMKQANPAASFITFIDVLKAKLYET